MLLDGLDLLSTPRADILSNLQARGGNPYIQVGSAGNIGPSGPVRLPSTVSPTGTPYYPSAPDTIKVDPNQPMMPQYLNSISELIAYNEGDASSRYAM